MIRRIIFLLVLGSACAVRAGQTPISSTQTAAEIEDIGEVTPIDSDFRSQVRARVTTPHEYTSNAQLTGYHDSSDYLFFPAFIAGYTTPLPSHFTLDVAARLEMGVFSENDDRSFAGYSLASTLSWQPTPSAMRIFIGVEPYRYDSLDTSDLITQALGLSAGTDWGFAFNHGLSAAYAGYSFTDFLADPTIDSKTQHRVVLGLTHQFRPDLYAQLFYAWQYSDFYNDDRHDSKHLLGLGLTYQIRRNFFTTLSGNWSTNDSDAVKASYESAGASLGFTLQF